MEQQQRKVVGWLWMMIEWLIEADEHGGFVIKVLSKNLPVGTEQNRE
jgi:hypothetical protein